MLTDQQTVSRQSAPSVSAVRVVVAPSDDKGGRALSLVRYLAVGACNSIFGYGCFAMFTLLLTPLLSYGYVLASLLANLFSIPFAFFGYKRFVFRTPANRKEWIRCVGVYASSMILAVAALPLVVGVIRRHPGHQRGAPYLAGAIVLVFSIVFSVLVINLFPSQTRIRDRKTDLDSLA
jgi:putative flippase GtrA